MSTVHLHYTPNHKGSEWSADRARQSFEYNQWDVKLVPGYTPSTVDIAPMLLENGQTHSILKDRPERYMVKLSILANHLRFWETTANASSPQIYAEHDIVCTQPVFDLPPFDDVLALHIDNHNRGWQQHFIMGYWEGTQLTDYTVSDQPGVHDLPIDYPWTYIYNTVYKNSRLMPGAACYALTPQGAQKLLDASEKYGTEQGDMTINTNVVDIKYHIPALVEYPSPPITHSNPHINN